MARPSDYTPKLAYEICERLAKGNSLKSICLDKRMPREGTIYRWVLEDREGFHEKYARAREIQAEKMFEELLEIADDGSNDLMTVRKGNTEYEMENKEVVNRSRLRVDTRKWYLSKVLPKKFGDKIDVTSDGKALPQPLLFALKKETNVILHNHGDEKDTLPPKKD